MGADPDTVPVTSDEVAAYYDSIESEYRMVKGFVPGGVRFALSVIRNARGFGGLTAAAVAAITLVTAVPSVAVVPPKVRRHLGIPRIADPVLAILLRVAQPRLRAVHTRAVGSGDLPAVHRRRRYYVGRERPRAHGALGVALTPAAR